MGAPSQTLIQNETDLIAATLKAELAGFDTVLAGRANASLWYQNDGSGDPDVENALGTYALAVDTANYPENYKTALSTLLGRSHYSDFAAALNTLATSSAGGGYANFDAYLTARAALIHPLFAELFRQKYGDTVFTTSSDVANVFSPNYCARFPDKVYLGTDGALVDKTTAAQDATAADVKESSGIWEDNGDALYIGSRYKFTQVVLALSTLASATITPTFQYWNGSSWATLTVTDNTAGFTRNDVVTWTLPADWGRWYKDSGGTALAEAAPLYYIRISRGASTLATPPVGTCVTIVPEAVLNASGSHLGVDQPPLAIVRITAADTVSVDQIAQVAYTRFKEPGVRARALTPIAQDVTMTIAYTDQGGADGSKAQSAWTAPAALAVKTLTLDTGDTGVRAIREASWAATTTATAGVFAIEAVELRTPAL